MTNAGRQATLHAAQIAFVEIRSVGVDRAGIVDGQPVELTSRRGRAVLPAVATERMRPGNCFAPFHWNDEHGEYLTINAVTNDAVDPDSLQPEFKVCAVSARPTGPVPAGARAKEPAAAVGGGPLVVWASQTGNAEDFAARLARRLGDSQLVNIDNLPLSRLAAARDVLIVTSTFGDGGPPDNGVDFWDRLGAPDAPALDGVRYAVLGIGDRSYADFCAHARSIDGRLADLAPRSSWTEPSARPMTTGRCLNGPIGSPRCWARPANREPAGRAVHPGRSSPRAALPPHRADRAHVAEGGAPVRF